MENLTFYHTWLPFIYLYGAGGVAFLIGMFLIIKTGALSLNKIHHKVASDFFMKLNDKNYFEEKETDQYYDSKENQFLADRFIVGTCPKCGHSEAYGDQCEKCGSSLNAIDLINPKSTLSDESPVLKKTKHWYLPLNKYENFRAPAVWTYV